MLICKLKINRMPSNEINVNVFFGEQNQTLQNVGHLILEVGEYQLFATALSIGSKYNDLRVEIEGEKEALR